MLPTERRFENVRQLIEDKRYFILHAPRQTGKTTVMLQLMETLNQEGDHIALYVNVEAGQAYREDLLGVNRSSCLSLEPMPKSICHLNIGPVHHVTRV